MDKSVGYVDERVFLGLGTNLGDRWQNLRSAREALTRLISIRRVSRVYETAPWGYTDQPVFLNQVLEVRTPLVPIELLSRLKELETELGRRPSFLYGPRLIDMDILLFGDRVIDQPGLVIPHPRLAERAFVLVPLVELAPELRHPILGKTIRELCQQMDLSSVEVANE